MSEKFARLWAMTLVVVRSAPAWGAAVVAVLTAVAVEVVPLLPGPWAVRVAGWVAALIAAIQAVVRVVSRVTPTPPGTEGLVLPEGVSLDVRVVRDDDLPEIPTLGRVRSP